jgi:hypothetical protein
MKLKSFCTAKATSHQTEETAYRMEENLCQLHIWQGINNQNIQEAQKANLLKNQQPTEWKDKRREQTILERRIANSQ